MKNLFFLLPLIVLSSCFKSISQLELNQSLQVPIDKKQIAGFGVCVFDKDSIFFSEGYGWSDIEKQKSYRPDTRQLLASVSKTFIGVALLKCQELGLLNLEDDINSHLPFKIVNPFFPNEKISIIHVATHTATFKYSEKLTDEYNYTYADSSLNYILKKYFSEDGQWYSKSHFHQAQPGQIWDYSNAGATLAAYIVERVSGSSYELFLKENVLQPLGMGSTIRHRVGVERSQNYQLESNQDFSLAERKEMGLYPVGDYLTSVRDLTRFYQMILNNGTLDGTRILTPKSVELLLNPYQQKGISTIDSDHNNMGIFWWHESNLLGMPLKVKGHIGGDTGVFTSAWFAPKTGKGFILFSNTGREEMNADAIIYIWQQLYRYGKGL